MQAYAKYMHKLCILFCINMQNVCNQYDTNIYLYARSMPKYGRYIMQILCRIY